MSKFEWVVYVRDRSSEPWEELTRRNKPDSAGAARDVELSRKYKLGLRDVEAKIVKEKKKVF